MKNRNNVKITYNKQFNLLNTVKKRDLIYGPLRNKMDINILKKYVEEECIFFDGGCGDGRLSKLSTKLVSAAIGLDFSVEAI